jgi:hypothetical protein
MPELPKGPERSLYKVRTMPSERLEATVRSQPSESAPWVPRQHTADIGDVPLLREMPVLTSCQPRPGGDSPAERPEAIRVQKWTELPE